MPKREWRAESHHLRHLRLSSVPVRLLLLNCRLALTDRRDLHAYHLTPAQNVISVEQFKNLGEEAKLFELMKVFLLKEKLDVYIFGFRLFLFWDHLPQLSLPLKASSLRCNISHPVLTLI